MRYFDHVQSCCLNKMINGIHSRSQQRTDHRVLVLTLKKKSHVKTTSQIFFEFFYLFSMQLFSADATIFSKKNQIYFLPMKT
jgi:hypothetical protein